MFPSLNNQAKLNEKKGPYLFEYYNVKCFSTNPLSQERNVLARLVNALSKVLNNNNKIPWMIAVIADADIITGLNFYNFGVQKLLEFAIRWIINNMNRAIEVKMNNLDIIKPGAVANKPKVI